MVLKALDDDSRKQFSIEKSVEGVVVTEVEPVRRRPRRALSRAMLSWKSRSSFIATPADAAAKVASLKQADRRNAQVMIANAKGDLRFVALRLE